MKASPRNGEVRLVGERHRLPRQRLGRRQLAAPRQKLRPHGPPLDARRAIVRRSRSLTDLAQLERSIVVPLDVERVRELGGEIGKFWVSPISSRSA